ncbi:MAG TPA: DUF4230 domain-containing protein [Sphingomicrobium sp.]|jgi:hypothetical protein|nr:DUF4230 domain-containing protein [Sphingomicrobium sp.]
MDRRLTKLLALAAIIVALIVGLMIGVGSGIADRVFGGPNPQTIATASLESMRAQNRLIAFVARYVSVTSSKTSRFGFSAERTLILPGDVRYELDLAKLQPNDVTWDGATSTLSVRLPEIEVAGPDVDLKAAREYGAGGVLAALTNSEQSLDQANRAAAVADLRKQASAEVPMRLARQAAKAAVERSFAMPLLAAGFKDAKVVARFPTEGSDEPSYLDLSTPYNQAIEEAERRRGAQGK